MKTFKEYINEATSKEITIIFGRMNPMTRGHEVMIKYASTYSNKNKTEFVVFPSQTKDKKKNPLSINDKMFWLKKAFPSVNFVFDDKLKTPFQIVEHLLKSYDKVHLVVGGDRVKEFSVGMNKYYGDKVVVVNSGGRTKGVSASDLRKAVKDDDFATFKKGVPSSLKSKDVEKLFTNLKPLIEQYWNEDV